MQSRDAIRLKLKRLIQTFKELLAKRKVTSNKQREKEVQFAMLVRNLFEVIPADAILSNRQNRFLIDQRGVRMENFNMIAERNRVTFAPENSSNRRDPDEDHVDDPTINDSATLIQSPSDRSSDLDSDPESDPEYVPSSESEDESNNNEKIHISTEFIQRAIETKASYRNCEALMKIGIEVAGGTPGKFAASKSSLWAGMTKFKRTAKNNILKSLADEDFLVIIQFDCKKFSKINARHIGDDERIVVLCHSELSDIPLGLFLLPNHSASECRDAIVGAIDANNLRKRVVGFVSDTEAVNTGRKTGTCRETEKNMQRDLLNLMCRHHVYETVLKSVYESLFGKSKGPTTKSDFNLLIRNWDGIKRNNFVFEKADETIFHRSDTLLDLTNEAKRILQIHACKSHIRHDYAEITDLALKFLGIDTGSSFKVLGATSNARWMFKIQYGLKMYLFRYEIDLDDEIIDKLERFCLFVAVIYIKFWNQCPVAVDAPINDLQFLKEIDFYRQIDDTVASAALTAFQRHLWYLGDELIILALFSDKVSSDDKDEMNLALIRTQHVPQRTVNSIRHTDEIENVQNLELHHFISPRSPFLLSQLDIDTTFLEESASEWHQMESYQRSKKRVQDLIVVVNDAAERSLRQAELLIDGQKVRSETRLQDAFVTSGTRLNDSFS